MVLRRMVVFDSGFFEVLQDCVALPVGLRRGVRIVPRWVQDCRGALQDCARQALKRARVA